MDILQIIDQMVMILVYEFACKYSNRQQQNTMTVSVMSTPHFVWHLFLCHILLCLHIVLFLLSSGWYSPCLCCCCLSTSRGNKCSYYEAISRVSGHKVTIKEHHIENYEGQEPAEEAKILSKLSHACIPRLREVFLTDNSLFMVMDFIDSKRLKNFIDSTSKTSSFAIGDVRTIVKSLLAGIHYCHERNIIIRNLTPDTIMVKKSGGIMHASTIYEVKITDFSCAVLNGSTKSLSDHPLFDWNDVPYIAPEALLEQPYSKSMDMWSVGVLIYLMIAGDLPFANSEDDKVLLNAIKVSSSYPLPLCTHPHHYLVIICYDCMVVNSMHNIHLMKILYGLM